MQVSIEIENDIDYFLISDESDYGDEGVELDRSPKGMFSTEFSTLIVSGAFQVGGFAAGQQIPVRRMTLPFHLHDMGDGIEATVSRFRKLWGSPLHLNEVTWRYTSELSGARWLTLILEKEILFSPERDWNIDGYAKAVVSAVALQPLYESEPLQVKATNPTTGQNTLWFPAWNPTDQKAWLEWALKPNGTASFQFPDFGFGQEQEIDPTWTPGQHSNRWIATPQISKMWSVMSDPVMDPYVAADLSNAPGQMGGVVPLYWLPPYTASADEPVLLPVQVNGPQGAQVKMILRRFWSTESGLE